MPKTNNNEKLIYLSKEKTKTYVYVTRGRKKRYDFEKICLACKFCITQLVKRLNISESSFRSAFYEYAGISPKNWMRQKRAVLAIQLIREGHNTKEIFNLLGYHDYSHMVRDFKNCVGIKPNLIRDQLASRQLNVA